MAIQNGMKKQLILDAARRVITRCGFAKATVDDVAQVAGGNWPSVLNRRNGRLPMKRYPFFVCSMLGLIMLVGCAPPRVVKHQVKKAHIRALSAGQMAKANEEREAWFKAREKYRIERRKLALRGLDHKLAKRYHAAARLRVKRTRLAVELKNKKVPVDVPPGAYERARQDMLLAKRNLEYRALLVKYHKSRVRMLYWEMYHRKARYMEEVVQALHKGAHRSAGKYRKFRYARQSARL